MLARDGFASARAVRMVANDTSFAVENVAAEGRRILLNEQPLDSESLHDGDLLTIGESVLSFRTTRPDSDA